MDICQESEFVVIDIFFKHGDLPNIQTKPVKYSVPDFFITSKFPPYGVRGVNLTVDLFQNIIDPEFYQTCIKSIEICDCSSSKAGCYSNCNYYQYGDGEENQHIAHRKFDHNGIKTL